MSVNKKVLLLFFAIPCFYTLYGQQMPFSPISYRIFSPFLINPAIAGSKDFISTDLLAGFNGRSYSQIISVNSRIAKKGISYSGSSSDASFTNIGIGASAFNDSNNTDSTNTAGGSLALSYHIPLNNKNLSFISIGASFKGLYHYFHGDHDLNIPSKEFYFPNADAGIYLYSPRFFAGVSATNFLSAPRDTVVLNPYQVPVSRQYNIVAGYKFILSRSLNLVLEPSIMILTDDSLHFDLKESIEPVLKLYTGNFCLGTYFNDYNKVSFFFQYRYPRFYIGTFFALPKDLPYFQKTPTVEIAVGINFSRNKSGYTQSWHW
ncbi:MAG: type IX secretion system membrane protein PorP/SprF [Bacteroidales bacterium]